MLAIRRNSQAVIVAPIFKITPNICFILHTIFTAPKNGVKAKLTEGGTLSPAFLYKTHSRQYIRESNAMVYITDWFPTLLKLARLEIPTGLNLDGVNQAPIFWKRNVEIRDRFIYGIIEKAYQAQLFKF